MASIQFPKKCSNCDSNSFTPAGEPVGTPVTFSTGLQAQAFSCDNCGTLIFKQAKSE